jgi:hypothetical protein
VWDFGGLNGGYIATGILVNFDQHLCQVNWPPIVGRQSKVKNAVRMNYSNFAEFNGNSPDAPHRIVDRRWSDDNSCAYTDAVSDSFKNRTCPSQKPATTPPG